jgi:hypothetical protein
METRDSRIYVGRLEAGLPAVYAVDPSSVQRLHPADEPLRWGAGVRNDASALARVLLADAAGAEPPAGVCRRFSRQILGRLPHDGFALQRETVNAWLRRVATVER